MADQSTGLLSPWLRRRRLAAVSSRLTGSRVLEVGCGVGELARFVESSNYLGIDLDPVSIEEARHRRPGHRFMMLSEFAHDQGPRTFDKIVALAVIEHVPDPQSWLRWLASLLSEHGEIVLTTPHPRLRWLHDAGATLGLFSKEAAAEHQTFLDRRALVSLADGSGLKVAHSGRFLMGCNQIFVLAKN